MKKLIPIIMTTFSLMAAPKAVVFDWGDVIGHADRECVVDFVCDAMHLSKEAFETANSEKKKSGKEDVAFWQEFAKSHDIELPENWGESYSQALKRSIGANDEMFTLIDELKNNGVQVGMLSNIDSRYSQLIRSFGYYDAFSPCLLSCEIDARKPDFKAYETLLEKFSFDPQEIVFVDDKLDNVEVAREFGIDAIHFKSEADLREELTKRGVLD